MDKLLDGTKKAASDPKLGDIIKKIDNTDSVNENIRGGSACIQWLNVSL